MAGQALDGALCVLRAVSSGRERDLDGRGAAQCLVDGTVALGQLHEQIEVFPRRVTVYIKTKSDCVEAGHRGATLAVVPP